MQNNIPTNLKGYEIIERIGAGGFGVVYRAKQTTINREVAIKVILPSRANQPAFIRRFETEAQLIARLEHPHITPLIDYWRDPNGAYLVMRYLRGGSVRDALANGGYELDAISRLLDQVASALEFAHRQQIIHRDIKPDNILLDEDGNAYLADFGIAKDLNLQDAQTIADTSPGSLDYISPEQARGEAVTPRTDIYALGVMSYEIITGEHPFKGASAIERLYHHINDPLPEINTVPDKIRDALNDIIQKATAKDPSQRYEDVMAFAIAFRKAIGRDNATLDLSAIEQLTLREHEVLQLIADGLTNRKIAQQLFITIGTTKWHINQLYKKLGVRNRVQAIVRGRDMNLIITDSDDERIVVSENSASISSISLPEPKNPYKGLHAFQTSDSRDFFGRDDVVQKLIARMADTQSRFNRFLSIVGPSGGGKSSLVKAGIIPALWQGGLQGSEKWFVVDMIPGTNPLDELETALTRVAANQAGNLQDYLRREERGLVRAAELILPHDDTELVVIVDQLEEVFTLVADEEHRQHFLDLLHTAATDKRSRVRVIVTLRADYYDKPLHYPKFGEMLRAQMETVLPLSAKGLERAVSAPAERVGMTFEPGLVAEIVSEMTYQAGALPLLQYAMTELFEQRDGRVLTRSAYQAIGGAVGALANRADEIFLSFNEEAQELTRQLFLRLVTLGEGAEDTRRRVKLKELMALTDDTDTVEEIIDAFASHRLLALDHDEISRKPTVEVAHEAILREWERLRYWLNEARGDIHQQRTIQLAATDWKEHKRDVSFLLRGSRLEQTEVWRQETKLVLTPLEREFIATSIDQSVKQQQAASKRQVREAELEQRAYNRLKVAVGVFAIATIISLVLATVAFNARNIAAEEWNKAQIAANESLSVALAVSAEQAFENDEHGLALALAIEANSIVENPLPQVRRTLLDIAYAPGLRATWADEDEAILALAISPDGRYAVSGEGGRAVDVNGIIPDVILWDVETGQELQNFGNDEYRHTGTIFSAVFTPDSRYVITVGVNNEAFRWDVLTGEVAQQYQLVDEGYFSSVAVTPDGQIIFTNDCTRGHPASGCEGEIVVNKWDTQTGTLLNTFRHPDATFTELLISPDGEAFYMLVANFESEEEYLLKRNIETGQEMFSEPLGIFGFDAFTLSSEGRFIAVGDYGNQIFLYDAITGMEIRRFSSSLNDIRVRELAFSPDGTIVVSGHSDGTVHVWDVASGTEIERFAEHSAPVRGLAITPDGRRAITAAQDGRILLWDVLPGNLQQIYAPENIAGIWDIQALPDGERVLIGTGQNDWEPPAEVNDLIMWNMVTGEELWRTSGHTHNIWDILLHPDGQRALTVSRGLGDVPRLWDLETGEVLQEYPFTTFKASFLSAISPDGQSALVGGWDFSMRRFDIETGVQQQRFLLGDEASQVSISSDGRLVSTGGLLLFYTITVWDIETGEVIQELNGHSGGIVNLAFLPGDRTLLSGSLDGTIRIWDIETGEEVRRFDGVGQNGFTAELNRNRTRVLFANPDDDVILLDLETGEELAQFTSYSDGTGATFGANDDIVLTRGWDGVVRVWEIPPRSSTEIMSWIDQNRVIRALTPEERVQFLLDSPTSTDGTIAPIFYPSPTARPILLPTVTPMFDTNNAIFAVEGENRGVISSGDYVTTEDNFAVIPGGVDIWLYDGQEGEELTIHVIADTPGASGFEVLTALDAEQLDARVALFAPDGLFLTDNNDISFEDFNARIETFELPVDGIYRIEVSGAYYVTGGAYRLLIESDREQ